MQKIKQIVGFLLTALAGVLGYNEGGWEMVASFSIYVVSCWGIIELIKTNMPTMKTLIQVVSWAIGGILGGLAYWLGWGIFDPESMNISQFIMTIVIATFAINGFADAEILKSIWEILMQLLSKAKRMVTNF